MASAAAGQTWVGRVEGLSPRSLRSHSRPQRRGGAAEAEVAMQPSVLSSLQLGNLPLFGCKWKQWLILAHCVPQLCPVPFAHIGFR